MASRPPLQAVQPSPGLCTPDPDPSPSTSLRPPLHPSTGEEFQARGGSSIEITDEDRQAGYDPALLDELKPRGPPKAPGRRTPPPPPQATSRSSPGTKGSKGGTVIALSPLSETGASAGSEEDFPRPKEGESVESFKHLEHPNHYKHKQASRAKKEPQPSRDLSWWQRPRGILAIVVVFLLVVGVGLGVGIALARQHSSDHSSSGAESSSMGTIKATPSAAVPLPTLVR